jgi:hypothetical protein
LPPPHTGLQNCVRDEERGAEQQEVQPWLAQQMLHGLHE